MGDTGERRDDDAGGATLSDVALASTKWYIESGGLVRGSYSGRRLRVAVGVQRRSEGEKDIACEVRAAREQGETLEVHAHRLGEKGVEALAAELRDDRKLRTLVLSDTGLGPGGASHIAEVLLRNECITDLTLQVNGIGDRGACAIAHGLASGSTCILRTLALEEEGIGEAGTAAIAAALSPRGSRGPALALLERLSLRGNPVSTPGAAALARALRGNTTLESMDLSSCRLTGLGAARLAEALPHNCTLLELRLVRNGIPVVGALALAAGLLHNEGLETLHLGANPCGEGWLGFPRPVGRRPPVPGLVQAISNPPLIHLSLFGTGLGNTGVAEMAHFLVDSKCKLQTLDLGDNRLSSAGAMELSKVLHKQTTITALDLWGNSIGSAGKPDADALARSIQRNKCLLSVGLRANPIEQRPTPMAIIQRAMKRNQKHADSLAREEELQVSAAKSYLSRSSSRNSSRTDGSSRSLNSATAMDWRGNEASPGESRDLVPSLALVKTRVSLGLPGQTPREVRELDANGRTGRTPRQIEVQTDAVEENANGLSSETSSAAATASLPRQKLLRHQHQSKRLLHTEHDTYVREADQVDATQSTIDDDQVSPIQRADRTGTTADEVKPELRQQKRKLRTPVLPSMPPRLEATATSIGLVAAAAGNAVRSVAVFVDNQTTMPLVLTDKRIGPKDGRWTWSEQLVPARIRQNEQIVMASESMGGTSHERRPLIATRAAATVVYRLESEVAEKFKGIIRLEGIAAAANAALIAEVTNSHTDSIDPNVDENATVGLLSDALAEAVSSIRVIVRRDQVQIRCRHSVPAADGSESSSAKLVTGWLGFSANGTLLWRQASPAESIIDSRKPAASGQSAPEADPEAAPEPEPETKTETKTELKSADGQPTPAENYDWQPKLLKDLGPHLEILSDSGEDGIMSLTFLVDGGAVASLLCPVEADEQTSAATGSRTNRSSSDKLRNLDDALSPSLAQRLGDALSAYGPEWLSGAQGDSSNKLQVVEVQVLPGCKAPAPQSCDVELSWSHEGRRVTAKWVMKHRVEGQDLAVKVSVAGAGPPSKTSEAKFAPYVGEEYETATKDSHLQLSFVVEPARVTNGVHDAANATDDSSESSEYIAEEESQSLIAAEPSCAPPAIQLVAQLRYVSARTERSSLVYFENRTPFRLTLLPSASLCSEGDWSDPNIWDEAQGLSHYTPAGPPANVLPFTTAVFACQSAGAKTGVAGRLTYHVHANETAAALPGWQTEPVRVMVSWATPYFGIPTCTSEIVAAPSLGRTGSSHEDKSTTGNRARPLAVLRTATNDDHNEVTFVLRRQQASGNNSSLFGNSSISSLGNVADLSHDEVAAALRAIDTVEL